MSYSRWGASQWYSFYNVNGKLSLWYDMEHTIDWEYDELVEIMQQDPEKIPLFFKEIYTCSIDEAKEAITYIKMFMEDYDPEDEAVVEYKQEVELLLNKWEKKENDEGSN
jgi:hypothetical protein